MRPKTKEASSSVLGGEEGEVLGGDTLHGASYGLR